MVVMRGVSMQGNRRLVKGKIRWLEGCLTALKLWWCSRESDWVCVKMTRQIMTVCSVMEGYSASSLVLLHSCRNHIILQFKTCCDWKGMLSHFFFYCIRFCLWAAVLLPYIWITLCCYCWHMKLLGDVHRQHYPPGLHGRKRTHGFI